MSKVRFIHTADVHLGSILQIVGDSLPAELEKSMEDAALEGFRRVCSTAIEKNVDFILIAGDLYDREARSVKADHFFSQECRRLAAMGIDVFVIAGNHDPLREEQGLITIPPNVKTFPGDQPEIYKVVDKNKRALANIIGQSYEGRRLREKIHENYHLETTDLWNIALLHTQLEAGTSNYIPSSLSELKERTDVHYWALGHIHQTQILNEAAYPLIAYPGIPQGRDFGEQGRGGCLLVELDRLQGSSITFLPTASVIYKRQEIFIDEEPAPETLEELEERINEAAQTILEKKENGRYPIEGYVLEWIIKGRGVLHARLKGQQQEATELLTENLRERYQDERPFLWTNAVSLRTKNPLDYEKLLEKNQVLSKLEQVIKRCLKEEEMQGKLKEELGSIWRGKKDLEDKDEKDDFRFHLDEDGLQDLLERAKEMILEKLVEGRE